MREIKFRIWDKNRKAMYFLLENKYSFGTCEQDRAVSWEDVFAEKADFLIPLQYTGLKDKDGKEIYEGDVFEHNIQDYVDGFPREENHTKIVTYDNGAFWVGDYLLADAIANDSEAEVIGNIFEHSHLLEQRHD
ncbi:YopX family protein [Oceanobacillus alkalisoli]|uniref:YopX family protein n=1 Tax=Oceanobacillus alkalisoli TaxID=2925113 RepID=UPI001F11B252|nr:YopX family protein [Oceanobacillus alkalisoli]MCF3942186.1 YopX family protein [Oceanobacillus alkalisoli]